MSLDPQQIQGITTLAWRHLVCGRMPEARVLFELLVTHMPARADLRMALAYAWLGCGNPDAAVLELGALESSSESVAHFLRGKALARAGRMAEARAAFERYRFCRPPHA